jgi:protein-S-isoprenylcysteine O-methyltransferase Ste14
MEDSSHGDDAEGDRLRKPGAFVLVGSFLGAFIEGASLWAMGSPLIVGSAYGLIPAGITVGLLVLRTYLEDKTLQAELPGCADYARHVRDRLIPGIW